MTSHTMTIGLTDRCVQLCADRIDLNWLWHELSKRIQLSLQDYVARDPLADAVASIL